MQRRARHGNGIEAAVVDFSPDYPAHPKVQCLRTPQGERFANPGLAEIDLALYQDLWIASVNGTDVQPFLAEQESVEPVPALA